MAHTYPPLTNDDEKVLDACKSIVNEHGFIVLENFAPIEEKSGLLPVTVALCLVRLMFRDKINVSYVGKTKSDWRVVSILDEAEVKDGNSLF